MSAMKIENNGDCQYGKVAMFKWVGRIGLIKKDMRSSTIVFQKNV